MVHLQLLAYYKEWLDPFYALCLLWSPYGIGQTIIFSCCCLFFLLSSFFPRLISAAADWMSAILPHMVWPKCEFKMQVWNQLHAARWKHRTQKKSAKITIWAPSHNFVGLYLRNQGMYRQSEKKMLSSNISSTCSHNMVNFGQLAAEIGRTVCGTPPNFNGLLLLAALLHGI